ncbi:outer membrane protein assembly factor BamA [Tepidamorphus sp. 3E244]|uniref:outer membrane protein assembly factor BamA n=1 Tax=Tepidamorphus sp. 3E244 TaxID=3385498 RepID=UPI0038FC2CE7
MIEQIDNPHSKFAGTAGGVLPGFAGKVRAAAIRFLALSLLVTASVAGALTVAPSVASAQTISAIVVEGNRRVDDDTVRSYVTMSPGQRYSDYAASESVKLLFQTGLFEDVSIGMSSTRLVVTVVEAPLINRVVFEGNKRLDDVVLNSEVESQPRGMLTRAKVQRDTRRILQLYRRIGRFGATVDPKIIDLPDNRVNLVFEIDESEKTSIQRINFVGNEAFSDPQLREVVTSRQANWLSWLRTSDIYDPQRLEADQELLRRHYLKMGYADFRVLSAVAELDRERNVFYVTFTVEEGPQYRFGMIDVESNVPDIDPNALLGGVKTREGRVYNAEQVEETSEELTIELAKSGYAFATVRPRGDRDSGALTIGITYVVDEGQRAYVERINIRGNTRTLDSVIRREFDFAEGDPYNRVLVDRARRRLIALGYFEQVNITNEPGSTPDRVIVNVDVTEQPTGEFTVGAGYSSASGFLANMSIGERNFLGRGQKVRASVGYGEDSQTFEFSFTEPYFMGRRVAAGFDVFAREYNRSDSSEFDRSDVGGTVRMGLPLNEDLRLNIAYSLFNREISNTDNASAAIQASEGDFIYSVASYEFIYSTLDDPRRPRNGVIAKFGQDIAGIGGDVNFVKTEASITHFHEVRPRLVTMFQLKGGHIAGWSGDSVRPVDAFRPSIRGFESFGPRDSDPASPDALGGNIYVTATAELQFPLPVIPADLGFSGAIFADAAILTNTDATDFAPGLGVNDDNSIRSSAGLSILWDSPFGLLRGDVGIPLTKEDYDETQIFKFGGGTRF